MATQQPNLLFIFTDEQAAGTMAAYGNTHINTPNMDRLASQSMIFDNAYVTQSVCTPSRSSLMTGLYPHTNGCIENNTPLPSDIKCLPELADFSNYKTAYHGKWHLGNEIFAQHGFDEWISIDDSYRKYYSDDMDMSCHSTYHDFLLGNGLKPDIKTNDGFEFFGRNMCCKIPEEFSKPAYLAKEASRFIRENRDNPFMLVINFFEPHMPYFSCRDDQYDINAIPLPENHRHEWQKGLPLKLKLFQEAYRHKGHSGLPLKSDNEWRKLIANYWGLTSLVDTHLGTILDTLSACGLDDNTIIVYTSDHGDMMGSHRLTAKCVQYEEAVKIPLLLKLPGIDRANEHITTPISQIDLVPTLLNAMNKKVPENLQGQSWLNYLKSGSKLEEENVFIEWNGYNNGIGADILGDFSVPDFVNDLLSPNKVASSISDPIRTIITPKGWKYNHSHYGECELYNLNNDPYEMNNLYSSPDYKELIHDLQQKISDWQQKNNDTIRIKRNDEL